MISNNLDTEIQLKELLQAIWQKKWFILSVTALCAVLGFSYANYSKPVFRATALLMPPSTSTVDDLNETNLKLFNAKNIFEIFTVLLKSEDAKYAFFKENILPLKTENNLKTTSEYNRYQGFSKTLRIDAVPSTENYKITFTDANPSHITKEINDYIQYINQLAFDEVVKISKKEHERKALLIQKDINFIKDIAKNRIQSQLIVLQEALNIAEAAGIKQPIQNKEIIVLQKAPHFDESSDINEFSKNEKIITNFDADPSNLYHNGSESIKAIMLNLSKRTNHEAFIPNLDLLIRQYDFYKNYQLIPPNNHLYRVDGINIPALPINFSKKIMTITALLLGLLLSVMLVLVQTHFLKNRQSKGINKSNQNENFAFR